MHFGPPKRGASEQIRRSESYKELSYFPDFVLYIGGLIPL